MYQMKEEYLVGVDFIDQEHKRLFEIAQAAYELRQDEFLIDKYDEVKAILLELKDYTLTHLEHEEEYMIANNYKNMFFQKVQHDFLRNKIEELYINLDDDISDQFIDDVLHIIADWLIDHILGEDKKLGEI